MKDEAMKFILDCIELSGEGVPVKIEIEQSVGEKCESFNITIGDAPTVEHEVMTEMGNKIDWLTEAYEQLLDQNKSLSNDHHRLVDRVLTMGCKDE